MEGLAGGQELCAFTNYTTVKASCRPKSAISLLLHPAVCGVGLCDPVFSPGLLSWVNSPKVWSGGLCSSCASSPGLRVGLEEGSTQPLAARPVTPAVKCLSAFMFIAEESIRERCLCVSSKRVSMVKPERCHSWWLRFCQGKERHPAVSLGMLCYGCSFQATAEELPSCQKLSSGHRELQRQVSEQHRLLAPGKHYFPSLSAVTHFKTSCPIAITKS